MSNYYNDILAENQREKMEEMGMFFEQMSFKNQNGFMECIEFLLKEKWSTCKIVYYLNEVGFEKTEDLLKLIMNVKQIIELK